MECVSTLIWLLLTIYGTTAKNNASNDEIIGKNCKILHEKYNPITRSLYIYAATRKIVILSSWRPPSQATAALLATTLKYRFGYTNVTTRIDNRTNCELASNLPQLQRQNGSEYDEVLIHVDADWSGPEDYCPVMRNCSGPSISTCNVAGVRLQMIGGAIINTAWHVRLTEEAKKLKNCSGAHKWQFYTNHEMLHNLEACGFHVNKTTKTPVINVLVNTEILKDKGKLTEIRKRLSPIEVTEINREALLQHIEQSNVSFLFIDYDLWRNDTDIEVVEETPNVIKAPAESLRVADVPIFIQYAPIIIEVLSSFVPHHQVLWEILQINTRIQNYEEASCLWANNNSTHDPFANLTDAKFIIPILFCNDLDKTTLKQTFEMCENIYDLLSSRSKNLKFKFKYQIGIKCHDSHYLEEWLTRLTKNLSWQIVAGIVAPSAGATAAAAINKKYETPVIFYEVPPARAQLHPAASTSTGRLQTLAKATTLFFKRQNWQRIGIISESSNLAEDLSRELRTDGNIAFREINLKEISTVAFETELKKLQEVNARVIYLNVDYEVSSLIICTASKLGMTEDAGYAFMAREWHTSDPCVENIDVYSLSYSWRGGDMSLIKEIAHGDVELQRILTDIWNTSTWPLIAAPLADALVMMVSAVDAMLQKYPTRRNDIHALGTSRLFAQELSGNSSIVGVTQTLRQRQFAIEDPLIYVTAWRKNDSKLLSVWKAKHTHIEEVKVFHKPFKGNPPHDGSSYCLTNTYGDPFTPSCNDGVWITLTIAIIIVTLVLLVAIRTRAKKIKAREKAFNDILLEMKRKSELKSVNREEGSMRFLNRNSLRLFEELGKGHYGYVRSGLLKREDRHVSELVAVKVLRDRPSEENQAEFLREAYALSLLVHENIVRLIGVCADQPAWLVMEYAFFGDLLHYLRDRRYLLQTTLDSASDLEQNLQWAEASFVSARELTRLAREAATALAHLRSRNLLHRDLRAANCLIDSTRTLKLADFGLAQWMNEDDLPNLPGASSIHLLNKPTAFPAGWMAPESINLGNFSYSSDVWALGVLILEVVTLGAPPYGELEPPKIIEHVKKGGAPPLPRDISMHTMEVTKMCWRRKPHRRSSAEEIRRYLITYPEALQPAYREPDHSLFIIDRYEHEDQDHTDSGFGDHVYTDWPLPTEPSISTI